MFATLFPFDSLLAGARELGLVVAVAVGFGFGFVLERAGFGRASKLTAQFYLTDMTVFKVMFGAIVTAMTGLVLASGLGLVDLVSVSEGIASPTFLWPMLAGGFLLGVGFIVSGYCPGTSAVATASGNLDGLVTFVGVILGSLLYGEVQPLVQGFHTSGDLGPFFLYQLLGLPAPVVALLVAGMAMGAFLGAEKLERIFSAKREGLPAPAVGPTPARRLAFATFGGVAALGLATLAFPGASGADPSLARVLPVSAAELAERVVAEPWTLRVIDLRGEAACAAARVPGAACVSPEHLGEAGLDAADGRTVVLVGEGDLAGLPLAARAYRGPVMALTGGFAAWKAYALTAPAPLAASATPVERATWGKRAALHAQLTGAKPAAAPAPTGGGKAAPARPKKKGGGCS